MRRAVLLLGALLACACRSSAPAAPPAPVDVPMTVGIGDDELRFSVSIQVGDAPPFDALLDTGSSGLVLLPGAVPDSAFASVTSTPVQLSYGAPSMLNVSGVVALATVKVGSLATDQPIPVLALQSGSCVATDPTCSVPAQIVGHFGAFSAILGVGMDGATQGIANPIVQLPGAPAYVVLAPSFGGTAGTLRIGPAASDVAAFQTVTLPPQGQSLPSGVETYDDRATPGCLSDTTTGAMYCTGTAFDTGTPADQVNWAPYDPDFYSTGFLPPGSNVQITLGRGASPPLGDYGFVVGAEPLVGKDLVTIVPGTTSLLILGTSVFFRYDVYEDQAHGVLGLSPHSGPASASSYDAGSIVDAAPVCWPASSVGYKPPAYVAAKAHQGLCTTAETAAFIKACGDNSTVAACKAWVASNLSGPDGGSTCGECIAAPANNGGIWSNPQGDTYPNYAACIQLTDKTHGPACAAAYDAMLGCGTTVCASCAAAALPACVASAEIGDCSSYANREASECADDAADGGAIEICSPGTTAGVDADLSHILTLVCGS